MKFRMVRTEKKWRQLAENRQLQITAYQRELAQALAELLAVTHQLQDAQRAKEPIPAAQRITIEYVDGYREMFGLNGHPRR